MDGVDAFLYPHAPGDRPGTVYTLAITSIPLEWTLIHLPTVITWVATVSY